MLPKLAPGMDRLLGVGAWGGKTGKGGGVELPTLFQSLLLTAHQRGALSLADARQAITRSHRHQFSRMAYLYRDAPQDGTDACIRVVLSQMVLQGLLVEEGDVWRPGPEFALDKKMPLVEATDGGGLYVELPSVPQTGPTFDSEQDQMREDIKILVQKLEPQGPGLRPVTREGIEGIKKSLLEYGLTPGYPLLCDQHGRLLSGRHRMAAEAELKAAGLWDEEWGETWPRQVVRVADDREALRIAMAGNCARAWTAKDFKRLEKEGLGSTRREAMRRLVVLALVENPRRSNVKIAQLVGCSDHVVARIRRDLEETSTIARFLDPGGRPPKERLTAEPLASTQTPQAAMAPEPAQPAQPAPRSAADWSPGQQQRRIYDFLLQRGPATDAQISAAVQDPGRPLAKSTIPTHRGRLVARGWVRDSGGKAPTASGAAAILWEAVPEELRGQPCQEAEAPRTEQTPAPPSPQGAAAAGAQPRPQEAGTANPSQERTRSQGNPQQACRNPAGAKQPALEVGAPAAPERLFVLELVKRLAPLDQQWLYTELGHLLQGSATAP